jgi:hypothetical protein
VTTLPPPIVAALRGDAVPWARVRQTIDETASIAADEEIETLLFERLQRMPDCDWPAALVERLAQSARAEAAREVVRRTEIASALDALARAGVHPVLVKGTPLAYAVYDTPAARPRCDTDLVIPRQDVERARAALLAQGYDATPYCDGELVLRQFEMQKVDRFGIAHALDIHWSVSMQTLFADLLSYDELAAESIAVPALGSSARAAGPTHALLLACVHPVMHHRNDSRAIWRIDIDRLASRFSAEDWNALVELSIDRGVATIVARALSDARREWGTAIPAIVFDALRIHSPEASAGYLETGRSWTHETLANLAHLPWRDRLRLAREIVFPSRAYMSRKYRIDGHFRTAFLPALYVLRLTSGAARVMFGRK